MGLGINENLGITKLKKVPILLCDKLGVNKKIYPCEVVKRAIENYKDLIKVDGTYKYVFFKHPKTNLDATIDIIAGAIQDIYVDEDKKIVYADIDLFPTKEGEIILFLLKNGYVVGLSIRGKASFDEKDYQLTNEKIIKVKVVKDLSLEGVDFVVFPSYMITQVSKENIESENNIFEQSQDKNTLKFPSEISCELFGNCLDYLIDVKDEKIYDFKEFEKTLEQILSSDTYQIEDISKTFKNSKNFVSNQVKKEVKSMETKDKNLLELEVKKLELEKTKLETEVEKLKSQLETLKKEYENVREQSEKVEKDLEVKKAIIQELLKKEEQIKTLEQTKEQLEREIQELEQKKEELEQLKEKKEEKVNVLEQVKEGEYVVVNCCGKKFDNDNPPKLRVVDIKETISTKRWGEIDHDITRKLVWLSQDKELASKVFGVIRNGMKHWRDLKYPVYEHRKSEKGDYDVDLVLNLNGLRTALIFALGRAGQNLSKKEKSHLFRWLYEKYKELKDAEIIDEIPQILETIVKRTRVLEQITIKVDGNEEHYLVPIIENLYLSGIIDFDIDENTIEQAEIELSEDMFIEGLAKAFNSIFEIENDENVKEQDYSDMDNDDDVIQVNTENLEELLKTLFDIINETEDAKNYGIETYDDFLTKIQNIKQTLKNGDVENGLNELLKLNDIFQPYNVLRYLVIAVIKTNAQSSNETENQNVNSENTEPQNERTLEQIIREKAKEILGLDDNEIGEDINKFIETLMEDYKYLWLENKARELDKIKQKALEQIEEFNISEEEKEKIIEEVLSSESEEEIEELLNKYKDLYTVEKEEETNESEEDDNKENVQEQSKGITNVEAIKDEIVKNVKKDEKIKDIIDFLKNI